MKLTVEMSLENAAYREYAGYPEEGALVEYLEESALVPEVVADSVEKIAEDIRNGRTYGSIIDIYGNKVGSWKVSE